MEQWLARQNICQFQLLRMIVKLAYNISSSMRSIAGGTASSQNDIFIASTYIG